MWRKVLSFISFRRRRFYLVFFLSLLSILPVVAAPMAVQKLVDGISAGQFDARAAFYVAAAILAVAASSWLANLRSMLVNELGLFLNVRIGRRIYVRLLRRRAGVEDGGRVMNLLNEYGRIAGYAFSSLPSLLFMLLSSSVSMLAAFYYDYAVALAALSVAAVCMKYVKSEGARIGEVTARDFPVQSRRQALAAETTRNLDAIRAVSAERMFYERWLVAITESARSRWEIASVMRVYSLYFGIASHLVTLTVALAGCLRLYQGAMTVGELLALQMLVGQAITPLVAASSNAGQFQMATVALRQVIAFLEPEERPAQSRAGDHRPFGRFGGVEVRGVTLTYPGAARPALNDISLSLPEKGVVAIVGRNGSGKTSLVRAMIGLERSHAGAIEIDGRDVRRFNPRWLRGRIGVVDQNSTLFSGTIRQNLTAGMTGEVPDDRIAAALRFASADAFVDRLAGGLDHVLREGGQNLSGGQRQRLAIARAVLRRPMLAIFDEPTSALDAEAAAELERSLVASGDERLVVIVTHHLFTARAAQTVVVLDDGAVAGVGGHDELLRACKAYADLWRDYTREPAVS